MGLVSSIMAPARAISESELRGEQAWLADTGDVGFQTGAGPRVSPDNVVSLSAVFAAARCLAEDVAGLPLKAYRSLDGGGKQQAKGDPRVAVGGESSRSVNLYDLVHKRPNEEMGSIKFRSILIWWAVIYGNAYAEIVDNSGSPVELKPIHPHRVKPKRDDRNVLYYEVNGDKPGDKPVSLSSGQILHIAGISEDGVMGMVIPLVGKESFGVYMAAERFAGRFFGGGATLKGVVTFNKDFKTDEARKAYIAAFNSVFNHNKWVLADNDAKVTQLGSDAEQSQLVETRKFNIEEAARWLRVPPIMIGHNTNTPYTNVESLRQQYFLDGMKPWALRIEEEFNLKLVPDSDPDLFVEHVVEALMWADAKTRAEVMNLGIRGGWRNPNEARDIHNLNPIPGGDKYRIETNLAIVDENGEPRTVGGPSQQPTPATSAGAVKVAMMPTMVSVAERIIDREVKAITSRKSVSRTWLDDFYKGHHAYIVEQVHPTVVTMARLSGGDATGVAERFADKHITESRGRIKANEDPGAWHIDRPAWIAQHLTDEVCDGQGD